MNDTHRDVGVEFGDLGDRLEEHDYPATADELVAAYGDYELQYAGGTETFGDALGSVTDTFESADEVHQSVLNYVGRDAVGRKGYTDRGTSSSEEDQSSF